MDSLSYSFAFMMFTCDFNVHGKLVVLPLHWKYGGCRSIILTWRTCLESVCLLPLKVSFAVPCSYAYISRSVGSGVFSKTGVSSSAWKLPVNPQWLTLKHVVCDDAKFCYRNVFYTFLYTTPQMTDSFWRKPELHNAISWTGAPVSDRKYPIPLRDFQMLFY